MKTRTPPLDRLNGAAPHYINNNKTKRRHCAQHGGRKELNLGLRKAQPLSQLGLALVGDKAAALVLLLKLRPLIFGIPLEGRAHSKVEAHVIRVMASTFQTTRARKKAISLNADASTSNLLDFSSSEESDNDAVTSDFSSNKKISSDKPGTSAVSRDVSTSFGRDMLPPAQRHVDFRPQRDPGIDLGMALRSTAQFIAREVLEL
ncbi:hypothetical protein HPB51_010239 [Rhipicephalus microplus]|uniref:Uncharacterized protein n=1 Tax=Rhipicephalus microplus TaxID=6941 RepID=A0A9J6EFU7_RHIMP|nr:hypothetical protein HPB51_010239 [Rhipicephalus microplus]